VTTCAELGGASNSRPRLTSETRVNPSGTYETGIDTARFLYRLTDPTHQQHASEHLHRPAPMGELKAGYLPAFELLWVEGRPMELFGDDAALLPAGALGDAEGAVRELLATHGLAAQPAGVSRVDVTATMRLDRPAEGWAILRGMAALDVPRRKPEVIGRPPETVYWATERGAKRERAYDKGLQLGSAPAGLHVRLEAQTRYRADQRSWAAQWDAPRVRDTFRRRFAPMANSAEGLRVADRRQLEEQLREFAARGTITPRMAELLMGHVAAESVGLPGRARATRYRRRAELRRLGLAQALDGLDDDTLDVDLGDVLADVLASPRWSE
jgi:hypothetical protein